MIMAFRNNKILFRQTLLSLQFMHFRVPWWRIALAQVAMGAAVLLRKASDGSIPVTTTLLTFPSSCYLGRMFWWDWSWKQKGGTLACFFVIAIVPVLIFGGALGGWRAVFGGSAFLLIPQIVGWLLFVGLKTGIMPARVGKLIVIAPHSGFG
jgi:hypothetical protein